MRTSWLWRGVVMFLACIQWPATKAHADNQVQNVIIVTLDGMRWQEVFQGADPCYMTREAGGMYGEAKEEFSKQFVRDTPEASREALMPFLWTHIAQQGQVFGDPSQRCVARVTNDIRLSYPGYNEMFTGASDDSRINTNISTLNPNMNVLEYLNSLSAFHGKVEVFASWDVMPSILGAKRNNLPVHTNGVLYETSPRDQQTLNQVTADLPVLWHHVRFDALTMAQAFDCLHGDHHPRAVYVNLSETDEWGHARRYDLYLSAAHQADGFLRRVWESVQSDRYYAGRTALIVTTDHGRGDDTSTWTNHGKDTPASGRTWIAVMGPTTPPVGLRRDVQVTQSQIAATIAALVGEDFQRASPKAAMPLPGVIGSTKVQSAEH